MNCEQKDCPSEAEFAFQWPGHTMLASCPRHAAWATKLADVFGFKLHLFPAIVREVELAQRVLDSILDGRGER